MIILHVAHMVDQLLFILLNMILKKCLRGLEYEKIMDFQYRLVVNENDPLATKKLNGYEDLEPYIELIHGDSRLPNGEYRRKSKS